MKISRRQAAMNVVVHWDREITLLMNRTLHWRTVSPFFRAVSNLGNGKFWYILMAIAASVPRAVWRSSVVAYGIDGFGDFDRL